MNHDGRQRGTTTNDDNLYQLTRDYDDGTTTNDVSQYHVTLDNLDLLAGTLMTCNWRAGVLNRTRRLCPILMARKPRMTPGASRCRCATTS